MDIRLLVKRHMNRRASMEDIEVLQSDVDEWRRELIKVLNQYHSELQSIRAKQAADLGKYEALPELQAEAYQAWEEKRLRAAQQLRRAEYDLAMIDQMRQVSLEPPMSVRERFLSAAIEAHRDFSNEVRSIDEHLYNALEGKWTFTGLPEELPWQESE